MRPPQEKPLPLRDSYPAHHPIPKKGGGGGVIPNPLPINQGGTGAQTVEDARDNLGLGSLATQNEGTGGGEFRNNAANDARFMQPGAFGLGAASTLLDTSDDLDNLPPYTAFYQWGNNLPIGALFTQGQLINLYRSNSNIAQIQIRMVESELQPIYFRGKAYATWGPWKELLYVVEASNFTSNGRTFSFIRLSDGTVEIKGSVIVTGGATVAIGGIFRGAAVLVDLPFSLPDVYSISVSVQNANTMWANGFLTSSTQFGVRLYSATSDSTNTIVGIVLKGRWV